MIARLLLAAALGVYEPLIITLPDGTEIPTDGAVLYPDAAMVVLFEAPMMRDGFEDD